MNSSASASAIRRRCAWRSQAAREARLRVTTTAGSWSQRSHDSQHAGAFHAATVCDAVAITYVTNIVTSVRASQACRKTSQARFEVTILAANDFNMLRVSTQGVATKRVRMRICAKSEPNNFACLRLRDGSSKIGPRVALPISVRRGREWEGEAADGSFARRVGSGIGGRWRAKNWRHAYWPESDNPGTGDDDETKDERDTMTKITNELILQVRAYGRNWAEGEHAALVDESSDRRFGSQAESSLSDGLRASRLVANLDESAVDELVSIAIGEARVAWNQCEVKCKHTMAYESGRVDGRAVALEDNPSREEIESWLTTGNVLPDEALINACETPRLASVLGISSTECKVRSDAFFAALADYNRGYQVGALEAISDD